MSFAFTRSKLRRAVCSTLLLAVAVACTTATAPLRELFGVRTGMRKTAVHAKLAAIGTLVREERKRQEAWEVSNDPRWRGALVGYDKEWEVRFITAVAKENGTRVRYAEVLDLAHAEHQQAGPSHTYRWKPPHARYTIIAIGNDPEVLTYLTLSSTSREEEEEEED
jgi:hypothetical protein